MSLAAFALLRDRPSQTVEKYLERCREAQAALETETAAAITIQRYWRGYVAREYRKYIDAQARRIQRAWLCFKGRQRFQAVKRERELAMEKAFYDSMATQIQRVWRGYVSRTLGGVPRRNFAKRKELLALVGRRHEERVREEEKERQLELQRLEQEQQQRLAERQQQMQLQWQQTSSLGRSAGGRLQQVIRHPQQQQQQQSLPASTRSDREVLKLPQIARAPHQQNSSWSALLPAGSGGEVKQQQQQDRAPFERKHFHPKPPAAMAAGDGAGSPHASKYKQATEARFLRNQTGSMRNQQQHQTLGSTAASIATISTTLAAAATATSSALADTVKQQQGGIAAAAATTKPAAAASRKSSIDATRTRKQSRAVELAGQIPFFPPHLMEQIVRGKRGSIC